MLLEHVEITYVSPCLADSSKIRLKAKLSADISPVMPYLNATVKNALYNHVVPNLTLSREFRLITLYPREMTMIKVLNTTDAWQVIDWLQKLINDTFDHCDQIEPDYSYKQRTAPLQLYKWLPRTNCKKCGELTCLAFAVRLVAGQQELEKCEPLFSEEYREQRQVLIEMTQTLGA